jgi:copper resistance protein C
VPAVRDGLPIERVPRRPPGPARGAMAIGSRPSIASNGQEHISMKRLVLAAMMLATPAIAYAHAHLKTATPAAGSTVATAPEAVTIDFTEGVEPRFSTITVQDAQGNRVDKNDVHIVDGNTHLAVGLTALQPGVYTVTWHATAVDTHKTDGSFSFTVKP